MGKEGIRPGPQHADAVAQRPERLTSRKQIRGERERERQEKDEANIFSRSVYIHPNLPPQQGKLKTIEQFLFQFLCVVSDGYRSHRLTESLSSSSFLPPSDLLPDHLSV